MGTQLPSIRSGTMSWTRTTTATMKPIVDTSDTLTDTGAKLSAIASGDKNCRTVVPNRFGAHSRSTIVSHHKRQLDY